VTKRSVYLKRPRGFTILSLLLLYLAVVGTAKGIKLIAPYGYIPASLSVIYGLTAMASAIGLWIFRPWALHATITWSITALLLMFNMQFGLNGIYTMPLHLFLSFTFFVILLLWLLLYYVKSRLDTV
jgi:hypothetical protein